MNNQLEGNQKKQKNKYRCNIFQGDHPTHLCHHMDDIQHMLSQHGGPQKTVVLNQS